MCLAEVPVGGYENCIKDKVLIDKLRKVVIYLYFDQSKEEKLVVLLDGYNNRLLAQRYKPSGQDGIVTVLNPTLKEGEIEFEVALKIDFKKTKQVVDIESATILYQK